MKVWILGTVCALLLMGGTNPQETEPRYRATDGELEYISTNEYMLWFVRGTDTLGEPISTRTREVHSYSQADGHLKASVMLQGLDTEFERRQVFTIEETGRVIEIDGVPVEDAENARVDFLPRLPADGELVPSRTWNDTVSSSETKDYGDTHYQARRSYRVIGQTEIEGRPALLIVAEGTLELRQGGWQDQNQGVFWWQEVEGPVVDSVWFDPSAGRVVKDVTRMDLTGTGGFGNGQQEMRMPSGLRSAVIRVVE